MSIARCLSCDALVDTDEDTDCYWHADSGLEEWDDCLCERCRDDQPEALEDIAARIDAAQNLLNTIQD